MLAGNARTEEESSLTGDADLHSNLLPVAEKVVYSSCCIIVPKGGYRGKEGGQKHFACG